MKHPISIGSILIIQTILVSNKIFKESNMSWFAYILFITIIGGIIIIFIYMSRIASNEKFSVTIKQFILMTIIVTTTIIIIRESSIEQFNKILEKKELIIQKEETIYNIKFFNLNKINLTIITIIILLLTIIIVTNIASTFEGPLKKTYV